MHNDPKKVKDIVISLLSIEGDSNFPLCISNRADNSLFMLRELKDYLRTHSRLRSRYELY